jgi:hypothetical protein
MSAYLATVNVPGYLPMDDEPPTFETPAEAWEYLADERRRGEDDATEEEGPYSDTVTELDKRVRWASSGLVCDFEAVGTVYGETPGGRMYDLGLAYTVTEIEEDETGEGE